MWENVYRGLHDQKEQNVYRGGLHDQKEQNVYRGLLDQKEQNVYKESSRSEGAECY